MMTELIIRTCAALCFAYYFINVAGMHMVMKRLLKVQGRLKPFDCFNCLSVWVALALYLLPYEVSIACFALFVPGFLSTRIK